jgi:hypothetical protein
MNCYVGCPREILNNPPPIGSVITVKHSGFFSTGTLRHAFYWRQRPDILWSTISKEKRITVLIMIFQIE